MGEPVALMLRVHVKQKSVPGGAGPRTIIDDLGFELEEGEIVALVGPSGCGKTTLLRIIGGLDTAFDGTVDWAGGRSRRIGTMFQEPRLLPWRTVQQNLEFVRPAENTRIGPLLEELGLGSAAGLYPSALSLGMARRAALARALVIEPELLLLDEPFVSLDPATAEAGRQILVQAWRAHGGAALLVTHDLAEAASLADRILKLSPDGPCRVARTLEVPPGSRRRGIACGARVAAAFT
ncbi:MAG: ATP-binding cassette domain-containing protein [Acetobacteraceae bacterium]|nr:ATP-binding cassette domain-containing protein [Acetobacteraceae bacterium]